MHAHNALLGPFQDSRAKAETIMPAHGFVAEVPIMTWVPKVTLTALAKQDVSTAPAASEYKVCGYSQRFLGVIEVLKGFRGVAAAGSLPGGMLDDVLCCAMGMGNIRLFHEAP